MAPRRISAVYAPELSENASTQHQKGSRSSTHAGRLAKPRKLGEAIVDHEKLNERRGCRRNIHTYPRAAP